MNSEEEKDDFSDTQGQLRSKGKRRKGNKQLISSADEKGRSSAPDGILGNSNT